MQKIIKVNDGFTFDDGSELFSFHSQSCCEEHYLCTDDIDLKDVETLEFDLDNFKFERIEDYGIAIYPLNGHPVRIPGYARNNGYYSSNLTLILTRPNGTKKEYNITECQSWGY